MYTVQGKVGFIYEYCVTRYRQVYLCTLYKIRPGLFMYHVQDKERFIYVQCKDKGGFSYVKCYG